MKAQCQTPASTKKCVSLFAQRGAVVGRSIGSRPVSLRDRDNPFLVTFLGKQKSDRCRKKNKVQNRKKATPERTLF